MRSIGETVWFRVGPGTAWANLARRGVVEEIDIGRRFCVGDTICVRLEDGLIHWAKPEQLETRASDE